MFKKSSFEDEIYRSMETTLVKSQTENKHGLNKLAKAADLLNTAASIFDDAGMHREANEVTSILQGLANDQMTGNAFIRVAQEMGMAGLSEDEMHTLLEESTPGQLIHLLKKVRSVQKGESTLGEEFDKSLEQIDLSKPEVRNKLISKLMLALKLAKFF